MTLPRKNHLLGALWGVLLTLVAGAALATHEDDKVHHLVIQVTENDPAVMSLALSNAVNVSQHYTEFGDEVEIEIVAYGPGLTMLRDGPMIDTRRVTLAAPLRSVPATAARMPCSSRSRRAASRGASVAIF